MKKKNAPRFYTAIYPAMLLFLFLFSGSCQSGGKPEGNPATAIRIDWSKEYQTIDGFGIAQAGWADRLYVNKEREEVMEKLFGGEGLRLNILRGEVFPHYWENSQDKDFNLNDDLTLDIEDKILDERSDDLLRRGQLWITLEARNKYGVGKLLFSTWSPPSYMKSNGAVSHGYLKPEYYQEYADYLAAFCKAYGSIGLDVYAISPSNEPGYEAPWNSCKWKAPDMGRFVMENLGPTLQKENIPARIVIGENPFWSMPQVETDMLAEVSSIRFVNEILDLYPSITDFPVIASGHGYTLPDSIPPGVLKEHGIELPENIVLNKETLAMPIIPFEKAEEKGMPVWVTEISTTDALDLSMENGLFWAQMLHTYFTDARINAFIWWGGAMPTWNNESLIVLDSDRSSYKLTKRYDTFGNFSRYIPEGSVRIETGKGTELPEELLVSAYKKGDQFTVVIINPTEQEMNINLQFSDKKISRQVMAYTTDKDNQWATSIYRGSHGIGEIFIASQSVVTLTGEIDRQ